MGQLLQKASIARFTRTLATTFGAGVPLVDALQSVSKATGNIVFANATLQISNDVSQGQQLQQSMKKIRVISRNGDTNGYHWRRIW